MTPKDPSFGGDFLGQILAAPFAAGRFCLHPIFGLGMPQFCVVFMVFQKHHIGQETPPEIVGLQGCGSELQRFFGPKAIFVILTLRFHCDFCGKSFRLRNRDWQSLAIVIATAWVTKYSTV